MPDLTAKRTLVKSPPELWEELSEVDRLARHLDAFGEIRITKLEPEHTVAWEGEHASGTVSIEPAGWGTKVTLTAELPELEPEPPEPDRVAEEPVVEEPVVEEPVAEEPVAEEPVAEEPVAGEPVASRNRLPRNRPPRSPRHPCPPAEPLAPKRRRGFWAWLFRERTAASAPFSVEPAPLPVPACIRSRSSRSRSSRSRSSPSYRRPSSLRWSSPSPPSLTRCPQPPPRPRPPSTAHSTRSAPRITAPSRAADHLIAGPGSSTRV